MKLNFTVFVCLTGLLFSSPALADPRLDVFVEKFQALGDKWVPGLHPDNPFGPYLDTRLEEGLDDTGRAELETAVRDGNCIRVGELMVEGFQHLYPFLDPAFEDPKSGPVVRFQILSRVQPLAETRCLMHRGYREIAARRNFSEFLVYDLAAEQQMPWASQMADDPDKDELMGILNILASMAFCNDYPPAQRDVWAMLNRSGGMRMAAAEELYLVERLRLNGLPDDAYDREMARIRPLFTDEDRFSEVQAAARRFRLTETDTMSGFWYETCENAIAAGLHR